MIFSIEKLLFNRFSRFFDFGMIDGKEKGWIEFMELFCIEKFTKIKNRLDQTKQYINLIEKMPRDLAVKMLKQEVASKKINRSQLNTIVNAIKLKGSL